jgi:RHS repeat-associated protein
MRFARCQSDNRYYSNAYGRFMTPDPAGQNSATPSGPQSWNQYAYVRNDPINNNDRTGLGLDDSQGCNDGGAYGGLSEGCVINDDDNFLLRSTKPEQIRLHKGRSSESLGSQRAG